MLMAQFGRVIVEGYIGAHEGQVRFNICEQVMSSGPRRFKLCLSQKLKINTHLKYLLSIWLINEA